MTQDPLKDYSQIIDDKYNQALLEIQKKKEKESLLKQTCDKLNDILEKLQITDIQFEISENNRNQEIDDMLRIIFRNRNQKICDIIKDIMKDMIALSKTTFTDLQQQICVKEPERSRDLIKNSLDKRKYNNNGDYQNRMMNMNMNGLNNEESLTLTKEYLKHPEKLRNKPVEGHLVEFAVNENKQHYIAENIGKIIGNYVNVKREVIKDGRIIHEDIGKRKLVAPLKWVLDTEGEIREYALENQISGYFLFKNEEDAMVWRCLTFQENREQRPYGIVIIKNQKVF